MRRAREERLDEANEAGEARRTRFEPLDAGRPEPAPEQEARGVEEHSPRHRDRDERDRVHDRRHQQHVAPERAERDQQQREVVHQVEREGRPDHRPEREHAEHRERAPDQADIDFSELGGFGRRGRGAPSAGGPDDTSSARELDGVAARLQLGAQDVAVIALDLDHAVLGRAAGAAAALELAGERAAARPRRAERR